LKSGWVTSGSLVIVDMDAQTTFAYAMNKMGAGTLDDIRAFGIIGGI
jgi:hypothetical protein